jgi:hypothetical protein
VIALGVLSLYPTASAGFVLVDDHEILGFTPQAAANPQLGPAPDLGRRIFAMDAASGRARPLYWVIRYVESFVFDAHPRAWHVAYIGLGIACALGLFAALRQLGIGRVPALLAGLWVLLAPGISTVWIRLGPQEGPGTACLIAGVWALAMSMRPGASAVWLWLCVALTLGAALIKESFTLVPPSLVLLWLTLVWTRRSSRVATWRALGPMLVLALGGGIALVAAYATARLSDPRSYGAGILTASRVSLDDATPYNVAALFAEGGLVLPLLMIGPALLYSRGSRPKGLFLGWCGGLLVVSALIIPQLILYRGEPGFAVTRYMLPAGLGLAVGFAAGAHWLQVMRLRVLFVAALAIWCGVLLLGAVQTWYQAESHRADSVALGRMVEAIAQSAPAGATVGAAIVPVEEVELAYSLPYHLAAKGRPDLSTRAITGLADDCTDLFAVVLFAGTTPSLPCGLTDATARVEVFEENSGPIGQLFEPLFGRLSGHYELAMVS